MSHQSFLHPERAQRVVAQWPSGVVLIVLSFAWTCAALGDTTTASLQDMCRNADQLAATPGHLDQALAAYQSVVDAHLANETAFDTALRQLARCYVDSGRIEEGMRYFGNLWQKMYGNRRPNTLSEVFNQFRLKYPEQWKKVTDQMQLSSSREAGVVNAVPAKELSDAILQRNDAQLRDKALERLQKMLAAPSSDAEKKEGLATLGAALAAKFDRKPFHELVLPLLRCQDADIKALALRCLSGLEPEVSDLDVVLPLVQDSSPKVRRELGSALILIAQGKEPERVIPALMTLMRDPSRSIVEWTIRSLWGQYTSPEFDEFLIQLARDPQYHHWVIYHGLSTMRSKSPVVCRRLVEELSDPDWNNSGRAAWGLTYGVTREAQSLVEEGLLKALPQETNAGVRMDELRALRAVATEKSVPYLQSVVESSLETDEIKELAREILGSRTRQP